jgi:predicted NACHT family NTPase
MPKQTSPITVFVSCPCDVEPEKQIVRDVCDDITDALQTSRNIQVKAIEWRKDVIPLITGEGAQSVINTQINQYGYHIYIGIMWKRFGVKQPNGLAPTEEEFENAFRRMQETGRPIIQFYFKLDEFYPNSSDEAQQATEVQKFKERIKDLGLYRDFKGREQFTREIFVNILRIIENFSYLTSKKTEIQKAEHHEPRYYLKRKVCEAKDYGSTEIMALLRRELMEDITTVIERSRRIVLLGDAGVGKTTELKRVAWYFSKDDSPFYPFFIPLNIYVNQNITELLPPSWSDIPESQLLVILDGLDEIEAKNKNDAIRRIEFFSQQHQSAHIIISCRTNFYKSGTEQSSGTLSGFSGYVLLDLDGTEIKKYIETRIDGRAGDFIGIVDRNQLKELLKIPFYLVHLVELFAASGSLPQSRAEIFDKLLIARMELDLKHFRTTRELDEKRQTIIACLERLALGMEALGRNYITDDEFEKLVADESTQSLLRYCTTWKNREGETITWQFEHNNFQEYLAARVLSRQSLETIKHFISFEPDHRRIIPSWLNTISFLLGISNDHDLFKWIIDNQPEVAVRMEPEKIDTAIRVRIFKEIFNKYKSMQISIDREKYRYSELAKFGQSNEVIEFLLTEIEGATHYTTVTNAIELLSNMNIPYNQKEPTSKLLVGLAVNRNNNQYVRNRAMLALADLKLNSPEVISTVVEATRSSENDWVRYALYYLLCNSDYLDENIDIFLEGIKYMRYDLYSIEEREARLADEHWYLETGIKNAKSPIALTKILTCFKENPRDLTYVFFEEMLSTIAENCASAHAEESAIFDLVMELFVVLATEHLDKEAKALIPFFDKTDTRLQAFQKACARRKEEEHSFIILAALADMKCIEFFARQYEEHNITDDDVWAFQSYLGWKNPDLYLPFNERINKKSRNKFILRPKRDFEVERKQRRQCDINLLFDKQTFMKEIKLIFDTEQKQIFTAQELLDIETHRWDSPYFSDLAIHTLRVIAGEQAVSLEDATKEVNSWDWNSFCVGKIHEYLNRGNEADLSPEQQDWIARWCYSNLCKVHFKTALVTKPGGKMNTSWLAIWLWYFLRKLNLTYPKDVLLDMLSFDWFERYQMLGIEYLEARLNKRDMDERIVANLQDGIQNDFVLKNHIDYCKRHNIKEVLPFALREIPSTSTDKELRRLALETACEMCETLSDLEQLLLQVLDDVKWDVVEQLVKRNSAYCRTFLLDALASGNEQEQLRAAEYLMEQQDLRGLEYYIEWIKRHKELPRTSSETCPLRSLRSLDSVPLIIELLNVSYQDHFARDHEFRSIILDTLTAVALQSERHYIKVKQTVEDFIKKHLSILENVNFLHAFLEKLEQRYYIGKSQKLNITGVIKKLEEIYSQ